MKKKAKQTDDSLRLALIKAICGGRVMEVRVGSIRRRLLTLDVSIAWDPEADAILAAALKVK